MPRIQLKLSLKPETDDIVLINKLRRTARRIQHPSQLQEVFSALGSNLNPILTQLAKTRRALFVEGKDFQILGKFARKLGFESVGNRSDFAVVPVEGFNPERIRSLKAGMEATLGGRILAAAILDKDYRSDGEREALIKQCKSFCDYVTIYKRKEIENFLLIPAAIARASARRVADQAKRVGHDISYKLDTIKVLEDFAAEKKSYVTAQYLANRRRYERSNSPSRSETEIAEDALKEFESCWKDLDARLQVIPGKEALAALNQTLQNQYGVSITATAILDAMRSGEIPNEMRDIITDVSKFASSKVR